MNGMQVVIFYLQHVKGGRARLCARCRQHRDVSRGPWREVFLAWGTQRRMWTCIDRRSSRGPCQYDAWIEFEAQKPLPFCTKEKG